MHQEHTLLNNEYVSINNKYNKIEKVIDNEDKDYEAVLLVLNKIEKISKVIANKKHKMARIVAYDNIQFKDRSSKQLGIRHQNMKKRYCMRNRHRKLEKELQWFKKKVA